MNWESLDWEVLDRLRADFLSGAAAHGPYWHTLTDLECYNFTFGERIGWKWDAVLDELTRRGWSPPVPADPTGLTVLDWGCGSGVAGRRVVDFLGADKVGRLLVHDHSPLAMDFSTHQGRLKYPGLTVEHASPDIMTGTGRIDVLVLSHVLNELHDTDLTALGNLMGRSAVVLWTEPGNHEVSRVLGHWRKRLSGPFQVVAPCPHQGACGILAPGNEQHWCHFFAPVPAGIQADSGWVRFGQRAGIDLRSLPYSFVALQRSATPSEALAKEGLSRIIGEARHYKGYAKLFSCDADGLHDLMLQKRDAPGLFKQLKHASPPDLHRWSHENGRITRIESP